MVTISTSTRDVIENSAQALKNGRLVAFPTETVYGLGANATNEQAIRRMYQIKRRPRSHPVIVHISSSARMKLWAISIPRYAVQLSEHFWPGPMTLIVKRSLLAKDFLTGGQNCIGLRVPAHPIALDFLTAAEKVGCEGVAAPSANLFGAVSPTNAKAVLEEIGSELNQQDFILDGGECMHGIESTIIECTGLIPKILRPGFITSKVIQSAIDIEVDEALGSSSIQTSGSFRTHYSPRAKVVLDSTARPPDGLIAFAKIPTPTGVRRLASPRSTEEFARFLYEALREGDRQGLRKIVVIQPKGTGLAEAIRDRLRKSAGE